MARKQNMNSFSESLDEYLGLRRCLGYKLRGEESSLRSYIRFLEERGALFTTTQLAVEWATLPTDVPAARWAARLRAVRPFAEYLHASDQRHEVPSKELLPHSYERPAPYLYTDEEVLALMQSARRLRTWIRATDGLRPRTYATLIGLLAVTGMRVSEAISLDRRDFDRADGVLTVRDSKFLKSRLLPLHSSTQKALADYERLRDRIFTKPKSLAFFVSERGLRLWYPWVRQTFVRLSREVGLPGPPDRRAPRLHDLRHRFAVQTLLNWYRQGANVEQRTPTLATYLGHVCISATYRYLSAAPELLRLAAARLDSTEQE